MEKLFEETKQTFADFQSLFAKFRESQVNQVPFVGSWTAGQLVEHVNLSNAGFAEVMNGETENTFRKPDEKVEDIKRVLLDFDLKLNAPDFIVPPEKEYDKIVQLDRLAEIESGILKVVSTLDLSATCKAFELPQMGYLTRLEAIYFVIFHTQRHTRQLATIFNKLA